MQHNRYESRFFPDRDLLVSSSMDVPYFATMSAGVFRDNAVLSSSSIFLPPGTVTKGTERETGAVRAIKAILKSSVQGKHLYRFKQEIDIMGAVDHPGIIKLYETFEDAKNIYLVEELCTGGEMFDRIIAIGRFSEVQSAILMKQILRVVFYLHCNRVMHRDLKAENFLFKERGVPIEDSEIKVIDFGLSTYFEKGVPRTTKAGRRGL